MLEREVPGGWSGVMLPRWDLFLGKGAGALRPARAADAEVVELGHLVVLNILCRCGAAVCVVPAMCAPRSGA